MRFTALFLLAASACATSGAERFHILPNTKLVEGKATWLAQPKPPLKRKLNVVLIVADDLGRADTTMYREGRVETPNLDRLAQQGVTYEAGYVTAALCSPSRAGLLTGRYQQRFGHEAQPHDRYAANPLEFFFAKTFASTDDWRFTEWRKPDDADIQQQGLPASELTLAELLKPSGYATGMFGKWHLGWSPAFQPHHRGFDDFTGFYEAYSLYASPTDQPDIINRHLPEFSDRFIWERGRSGISQLVHNGAPIEESRYLTDRFTDDAIAFIDAHKAEPFFLYLPFQNPHTPFQAKQSDYDAFPNEPDPSRRTYLALIRSLDSSVGRVLDALEQRHLSDDTLVIFISDNGGALYTRATTNTPFQGGKFTLLEGGIRVPFAMRWPGSIPAGVRFEQPVSALDVVATISAATGLQLPSDRLFDGVDLLPFVRGEKPGAPHDALFWRAGYASAIRRGPLKLIRDGHSNTKRLFDVVADPGEHVDLATSRSTDLSALEQELDAWSGQCAQPLWPTVMDYRFVGDGGREYWYPL